MPKKKCTSPIDDVFGNRRHRNGNESSNNNNKNNAVSYVVTKTKYQRLANPSSFPKQAPPLQQQHHPNHQYHRSQQHHQQQQQHPQQQQHRPHLGRKKESISPRKQLCTVPRRRVKPNYEQYKQNSLKRSRPQQQQQQQQRSSPPPRLLTSATLAASRASTHR